VGNKKAKKRKSPQFVVQIKVVVQYSRKNCSILAHKKAKKCAVCCSNKGSGALFA
jgi:hypothetical protein